MKTTQTGGAPGTDAQKPAEGKAADVPAADSPEGAKTDGDKADGDADETPETEKKTDGEAEKS